MLRIGLIGTESTHAATFAKLLQTAKSNAFPAAVLDEGDGEGQKLAERFGIAQVCATPEELLRHVDAVMICYRLADKHFEPAAKALAAGRHVWLDKPFTAEAAEARALLRLADQNGLVLTGGSTCRFCADVRAFGETFRTVRRESRALAGNLNYMGHPDSPYGGVLFYGPHAMSLTCEVFGCDAQTVLVLRQKESLVALVRYRDLIVSVHMSDCRSSYGELFTPEDIIRVRFRFDQIYEKGLQDFLYRMRTGAPNRAEELVAPVRYLAALRRSLQSGREEDVRET